MSQWFNPNTGVGSVDPGMQQQMRLAQALRSQQPQQAAAPATSSAGIGEMMGKLIPPMVTDGGYSVGQGNAYAGTTSPAGVFTPNRRGM